MERNFNIYTFGIGSILGFLAGNAAGSILEDTKEDFIKAALALSGGSSDVLGPGQISDEGELLMCSLCALAESRDILDVECVAKHYAEWGKLDKFSKVL